MSTKRVYIMMIGLAGLLSIAVIGALLLSLGILHNQSDKLVEVKLENRVLDEQQTSLLQAKKSIEKYTELNTIARAVVPQDKDQAKTVRDISAVASSLDIKLSTISFPASTLGQPKTANGKSTVTQVAPVSGIPNVYDMQISVQQDTTTPITYDKFLEFLGKLETNRRTAQVTSVTVQPTIKDRTKLTFNLVLSTYIKP